MSQELNELIGQLSDALPADERERVGMLQRLLGNDVCRRLGIYHLPDAFLLTVVIPVYNEALTVERVVERVRATDLPCEIILVNDGSRDGSDEVLDRMSAADDTIQVFHHERNQGKGAALRTGFAAATGDVVVIQDADEEYDPADFRLLLQPIIDDQADVVYGSRFSNTDRPVSPLWHEGGNKFITRLSNLRTGMKFTDVETCYKMFRRSVIQEVAPRLRERGFGIELELTARLSRLKDVRFFERPITYRRRSYADGKKITWRDGLWAMWCILRY